MDKVQHFEIPADDLARARKFYESAFGWNTADWPMPEGGVYVGLRTGPVDEKTMMPKEAGYINGGMYARTGDIPAKGPSIAITVGDMTVAMEKVKAAGGVILHEPKKIGEMGIFTYMKDTEGNIVGLWQNLK